MKQLNFANIFYSTSHTEKKMEQDLFHMNHFYNLLVNFVRLVYKAN